MRMNGDLRVAYRASREGPRDIVVAPNWTARMSAGCWPHGVPLGRGAQTKARPDKNWLADILPEIDAQWHPTRNKSSPHTTWCMTPRERCGGGRTAAGTNGRSQFGP